MITIHSKEKYKKLKEILELAGMLGLPDPDAVLWEASNVRPCAGLVIRESGGVTLSVTAEWVEIAPTRMKATTSDDDLTSDDDNVSKIGN